MSHGWDFHPRLTLERPELGWPDGQEERALNVSGIALLDAWGVELDHHETRPGFSDERLRLRTGGEFRGEAGSAYRFPVLPDSVEAMQRLADTARTLNL